MPVNVCNARMPADESQLTNGRELEGLRVVPAEDSYDIARDQSALACCVLCGRRVRTFGFRFGNFSAVTECPDTCMIRHRTTFIYNDPAVLSALTVELSDERIRGNPARPNKHPRRNTFTILQLDEVRGGASYLCS